VYWVFDSGDIPAFGLLRCVTRNAMPSGSLMIEALGVGLDDAVQAVYGHDSRDSKLCRLLNDPVHLVAFDQGLSEYNGRGPSCRLDLPIKDSAVYGLRADMGHFYTIAGSTCIVQSERISWV
jgi:hypothetical protein